ncbi:PilZ domain-containing protein [Oscillospiraceae bacterium PP1C4]
MISIPLEYKDSICEIKTMENELIATGIIREITPDYIEIVDKFNNLSLVRYATQLKITIFNSKVGFRVIVGRVYTSTTEFLRIVDIINLLDYERRSFFRVETKLTGHMTVTEKAENQQELAGKTDTINITIKNLSLGGALIASEYPLETGDKAAIGFKLKRKEMLFQCVVRRIKEGNADHLLYGCEFLNASQKQINELCNYIFQRQRELLSQSKLEK